MSRGRLPPGSEGRLFRYDPPLPNSFADIGYVSGEAVIYSLTKSYDGIIYGGTGENAHFFKYVPGGNIDDFGPPVAGEIYICDLTYGCVPGDNRVFGGTFPNAYFFWYDPDLSPDPIPWGQPVPGETGIWSLTSGTKVAGFVVGGTGPAGYLFQFEAMADTPPPPFFIGPLGGTVRALTTGRQGGPNDGRVYGGTLGGGEQKTADSIGTAQAPGWSLSMTPICGSSSRPAHLETM